MWNTGKRLILGAVLIFLAAGILILSDWKSRKGQQKPRGELISVALLKHTSSILLDEVEAGVLETLASRGYRPGRALHLQRFCAEGDQATSSMIARQISDGAFRMALTISTLSMQAVASANQKGKLIHVFAAVTDPVISGVGIRRMDSLEKPPYMTGIGTFQPVERSIRMAKSFKPDLKVLGAVWNPSEANSEACTIKARAVCKEMGITLLEASIEQSREVREAVESLIGRGAQAFWMGGDIAASSAIGTYCDTVQKAGLPLFSNTSGFVRHGTLFDLGANYYEVGAREADIAADILDGKVDPAKLPVTDFMPARIMLNEKVRRRLKEDWQFTEEARKQAAMVIDADGREIKQIDDLGEPTAARPAG